MRNIKKYLIEDLHKFKEFLLNQTIVSLEVSRGIEEDNLVLTLLDENKNKTKVVISSYGIYNELNIHKVKIK